MRFYCVVNLCPVVWLSDVASWAATHTPCMPASWLSDVGSTQTPFMPAGWLFDEAMTGRAVYSFAILMYELYVGHPAYEGYISSQARRRHSSTCRMGGSGLYRLCSACPVPHRSLRCMLRPF